MTEPYENTVTTTTFYNLLGIEQSTEETSDSRPDIHSSYAHTLPMDL